MIRTHIRCILVILSLFLLYLLHRKLKDSLSGKLKYRLICDFVLFAVIEVVSTGMQTNASSACVSFRAARVIGTIFAMLGVIVAAVTSI